MQYGRPGPSRRLVGRCWLVWSLGSAWGMIGAGIDGLQSAESQLVKPGPTCFRPSRELDATRHAQARPQLRPADAAPRGHGLP
eukprot:scaffold15701_cov63-Phaeocystis_antarctica.AAC.2